MNSDNNYIAKLEKENNDLREDIKSLRKMMNNHKFYENDDIQIVTGVSDNGSMDSMYRMLIENMMEGALMINSKRIVVYSNKHFASSAGIPLQKVIGANFSSFLISEDRQKFSNALEQSQAKRSFCEIRFKTSDSSQPENFLVSVTSVNINKTVYYCVIVTDISFQKKKEAGLVDKVEERTHELAIANTHLNEINREINDVNVYLDNFVHAIAHDLRAPVANLKLAEELLATAGENEKEKLLQTIHGNVDRLDITLKGLVQIIDTQGRKESGNKNIDVIGILNEVIEEQRNKINELGAEIKIEKATEDKITYVEGYIRSIARNALSNALNYTLPGKKPVLTVTFGKNKEYYLLSFRDNGMGIDLSKYGKDIFRPFHRLSSKGKGLGIGLHIVNTMIKKNGGFISVESEPKKGSIFTFHLKEYQ